MWRCWTQRVDDSITAIICSSLLQSIHHCSASLAYLLCVPACSIVFGARSRVLVDPFLPLSLCSSLGWILHMGLIHLYCPDPCPQTPHWQNLWRQAWKFSIPGKLWWCLLCPWHLCRTQDLSSDFPLQMELPRLCGWQHPFLQSSIRVYLNFDWVVGETGICKRSGFRWSAHLMPCMAAAEWLGKDSC